MTRTFLFGLILLASAAWVQAQSQYPQTSSGQSEATASGHTTVEGCLQGSGGTYTLTDKNGTTYQLEGDTSKLTAHAGHEVQITGSTTAATSTTPNPTTGTATAGGQQPMLTVQKVKHISESCKSATPK
ncbi:MAG TPA: DUF5818 domain-containing protein [Terriglobales bacterium]|jgi:hypothetical protein|nr:DUF5818 domain-containing protein [Terriglobales bacterium]